MISNPAFELAKSFVNNTDKHVFLTGKAGTGKTTFLKHIKENTPKNTVIVAPTGVAAINAGGTTIHSFFQLPPGSFIPEPAKGFTETSSFISDPNLLIKNLRISTHKKELFKKLELLIIDEVSMLRCDLLDAIDTVLRHIRRQPLMPFGGVQMLYIGDLFQLPPVARDEDWILLQQYYKSPFFFDARALQQVPPLYMELKTIYRQSDPAFVALLNRVRNNELGEEDILELQGHYKPQFSPAKEDGFITLTTHNRKADAINQSELNKLSSKTFRFEATIEGDFPEKAFPTEKTLQLKEGAQVMFLKNDQETERRFYNGRIGQVKKLSKGEITVLFPETNNILVLEKETWRNIRYVYNKDKKEIEEKELGTFTQYPIRLAWAITIHKSQGLTFEKAVIDAGSAFAPGQVYVALSRCTALEGIVLHSRIFSQSVMTDERVMEFAASEVQEDALRHLLVEEGTRHTLQCLRKTFNWNSLLESQQHFLASVLKKKFPDKVLALELAEKLLQVVVLQQQIAEKFQQQLQSLNVIALQTNNYGQLKKRMSDAVIYFKAEITDHLLQPVTAHLVEMEGKSKVKKYLKEVEQLKAGLQEKNMQLEQSMELAGTLP